jgi:hypothetical protein
MLGYIYESGLDSLRASFVSGSKGLRQKIEDTRKTLDDYQHSLQNGGEWIGERDPDEGYVIWDQEQVLEFDIDAAQEAYGELRKAFAIAWRAVHEEHAVRADLKGYEDYAARVPYRFIPFVW